jgi:membrane-bound lytic murein transglycosylase D
VIYRGGGGPSTSTSSSSTTAAASSSSSSSNQSSTPTGTYTVKSGDTLSGIATRHGVTVNQLKQWNGLTSNNIKIGQKLKLNSSTAAASSSASSSGDYTTYTVKSGDSLYSIAKNYSGVSAQDIMNFNGMSSSNIKPGMKIKIPKK